MHLLYSLVANFCVFCCLTFKDLRTLTDVIYQSPGGFTSINSPIFYSSPTTVEQNLADRIIRGEYYYPATNALWFYAPSGTESCKATWWDQRLSGRYKSHCFYEPDPGVCPELH